MGKTFEGQWIFGQFETPLAAYFTPAHTESTYFLRQSPFKLCLTRESAEVTERSMSKNGLAH